MNRHTGSNGGSGNPAPRRGHPSSRSPGFEGDQDGASRFSLGNRASAFVRHERVASPSPVPASTAIASDKPKRKRPKTIAACDTCQKRKTRCEMVSRDECHRCRTLGIDCVFTVASTDVAGGLGGSHEASGVAADSTTRNGSSYAEARVTGFGPQEWGYVSRLEQRLARMETTVERLVAGNAGSRSGTVTSVHQDGDLRAQQGIRRSSSPQHLIAHQGLHRSTSPSSRASSQAVEDNLHSPGTSAQAKPHARNNDPVSDYYHAYGEDRVGQPPTATATTAYSPDTRLGAYLHVSSMLLLNHSPTFADPQSAGIIEEADMQAILNRFPEHIPSVFPLQQILSTSPHILHSHPFIRSCVLHHLGGYTVEKPPSRQTLQNTALVLRNLAVVPAALPAIPIAIALFILSLSPASRTDVSLPRTPDPYEAASRGMRIALRLGLDQAAYRVQALLGGSVEGLENDARERRRREDALVGEEHEALVSRMVLWYAISHKAAFIEILSADSFVSRPSITPPITALLSRSDLDALKRQDCLHLHYESRLIALVTPISAAIASYRYKDTLSAPSQATGQDLIHALSAFSNGLSDWREAVQTCGSYLILQSYHLELTACIKLSNDYVTSSARREASNFERSTHPDQPISGGRATLACAHGVIDHVVRNNMILSRLPAYNLTLCFAAYSITVGSGLTSRDVRRRGIIDPESFARYLEVYRAELMRSHVGGASYIDRIDTGQASMAYRSIAPTRQGSPARLEDPSPNTVQCGNSVNTCASQSKRRGVRDLTTHSDMREIESVPVNVRFAPTPPLQEASNGTYTDNGSQVSYMPYTSRQNQQTESAYVHGTATEENMMGSGGMLDASLWDNSWMFDSVESWLESFAADPTMGWSESMS